MPRPTVAGVPGLLGARFFGVRPKGASHEPDHQSHGSDALYDSLVTDLLAIGDISIDLNNDEPAHAKRLRRRFEVELRLLDDLGWEKEPDREQFELRMPAGELRPIIERIYWSAVGSLTNHPDELVEEAAYQLKNAVSACPELLAMLAEDDLPNTEVQQGVAANASTE